jgi:hypothetical protein
LVLQALGSGEQKVSAEELEEIQKMIDNLKNQ